MFYIERIPGGELSFEVSGGFHRFQGGVVFLRRGEHGLDFVGEVGFGG